MKNLRTIGLMMSGKPCCYPGSSTSDRLHHRLGLCIINVGALHRLCPNLVSFDGIFVGHLLHGLGFQEWQKELKKIFYNEYVRCGGNRSFMAFRSRWLRSKPSVPLIFGKKRFST